MTIRLETESQKAVQKPFQYSFFFFFLVLDLLVERITHPANIWAAEEHKCFTQSPNGKSVLLRQPPVPWAQKLPVGMGTFGSHESLSLPGEGPLCQYALPSIMPGMGEAG